MKKSVRLVSVVIVTRDRNELLIRAVQSVFAQGYGNIELIVVDNCSITPPNAEALSADGIPIKIIRTTAFLPASAARNFGVKMASGFYICFLDDDDYYLESKIQKLMHIMEGDQNIDVVYGNTKMLGQDGMDLGLCSGPVCIESVMKYRYIHMNSILAKKTVLVKETFDESMTTFEDIDLTFRLVENFYCVHLDEAVAVWNRDNRPDQLTIRTKWSGVYRNWLILCQKFSRNISANKELADIYYKKMFLLSLIKIKFFNSVIYLYKYIRYSIL